MGQGAGLAGQGQSTGKFHDLVREENSVRSVGGALFPISRPKCGS